MASRDWITADFAAHVEEPHRVRRMMAAVRAELRRGGVTATWEPVDGGLVWCTLEVAP